MTAEEIRVLIGNIIGIIAVAVFVLSYQMKTRKKIMLCNLASRGIYVIQYIVLTAYEGILDITGMIMSLLAYNSDKPFIKKHLKLFRILSNVLVVIVGLTLHYFDRQIWSLLPIAGVLLQSGAMWIKNERTIRIISFIGSPFWCAFNFHSRAFISGVGDIFTMISIASAFVRYDILKREHENAVPEKEKNEVCGMKKSVYNNEAFDIIVLAGQSNAYGYGLGEVSSEYVPSDKILWVNDDSNPHFVEDENGVNTFFIDYPVPPYIEIADEPCTKDGKTGKLSLIFAREYINADYLKPGRRVLVINAAVGGSGFLWGQWGIGNILYTRLCDMLDASLALNPENRLVAFLWHQGETDAGINRDWDAEYKYEVHKKLLSEMMQDFNSKYSACGLPFISGGFCDEWYSGLKPHADPILRAIRDVTEELGGSFVETAGLDSNNRTVGNGDPIHFSRESTHKLGKMYFEKYKEIKSR